MIQTQRLSAFAAFATLALTGVNNDWSSRCDRITNPAQAETGDARGAPPPLAAWNLMAHNLFVNLYYDFASDSRMTPYVGLGAGGARTTLDYFSRWKRNDDPDLITTFEDPLLRARLGGHDQHRQGVLEDGGHEWVQLRSHESDVGRGSRILQDLSADAVSAIGVGVSMRYRL